MSVVKHCDLCRKPHDINQFFVKLKESHQVDGVSDICEPCYYILDDVFNKLPNPELFNFTLRKMVELVDYIKGT